MDAPAPSNAVKVLTVVGARPQFIKAAPVSRVLRRKHEEFLLHTGQHYDDAMSDLFFRQLSIPAPDRNLEVGSGPHGAQTGRMLERIEHEGEGWLLPPGQMSADDPPAAVEWAVPRRTPQPAKTANHTAM